VKRPVSAQLITCWIGFIFAMRIQHVAQAATSWPDTAAEDSEAGIRLSKTIERIRWRLWYGQVGRGLELVGETVATLEALAETTSPTAAVALKVARLLGELEVLSELAPACIACDRGDDDVGSGGLQQVQYGGRAAKEVESAAVGGNMLVLAGAGAEEVAHLIVALAEPVG
jgi:hypothetical protein